MSKPNEAKSTKPKKVTPADLSVFADQGPEVLPSKNGGLTGKSGKKGKPFKRVTECKVSLKRFMELAEKMPMVLDGQPRTLEKKQFASGSFGWHHQEKMQIVMEDGTELKAQVNVNITIIGSVDAPRR